MKPVSFARFRLYTLGSARPAGFPGELREIWENEAEDRMALLSRGDGEGGHLLVLARAATGRFGPEGAAQAFPAFAAARGAAQARLAATALAAPAAAAKVQQYRRRFDLLAPVVQVERQHPYFRRLLSAPHGGAARRILAEIGPWLAPTDPHFVREFQTAGHDQRLWEIYLWACLREAGYEVDQAEHPDFLLSRRGQARFSVEATTVAPSTDGVLADHPDPNTEEEMVAFLRDYMPMKFGGALTAKLNKRVGGKPYWDLPGAAGLPFLIAVADFHVAATRLEPGSMTYSQTGLPIYLYGVEYDAEKDAKGELVIGYRKRPGHAYKAKKIESGFFELEGAEHVAAVLFSNAGTISKFTRMGVVAGFGGADFRYFRKGFVFDPDPNAATGKPFFVEIDPATYGEDWGDELQVFHNPRAALPFDPDLLPDATHHHWEDGAIVSYERGEGRRRRVTSSVTHNLHITDTPEADAAIVAEIFGEGPGAKTS
jgi:hypothetical protein